MAPKSLISDLDDRIGTLTRRRKLLIVKSAERFACAATKSGVAEIDITDAQIERFVHEIAARFCRHTKETSLVPPEASQPADRRSRATPEHAHGD